MFIYTKESLPFLFLELELALPKLEKEEKAPPKLEKVSSPPNKSSKILEKSKLEKSYPPVLYEPPPLLLKASNPYLSYCFLLVSSLKTA